MYAEGDHVYQNEKCIHFIKSQLISIISKFKTGDEEPNHKEDEAASEARSHEDRDTKRKGKKITTPAEGSRAIDPQLFNFAFHKLITLHRYLKNKSSDPETDLKEIDISKGHHEN